MSGVPSSSEQAQRGGLPEPVLDLGNIQGNSIAGFNKSYQTLLFYNIEDVASSKLTVGALGRLVATAEKVLEFNRSFKGAVEKGERSGPPKATWVNVAFSSAGLAKLTSDSEVALFVDRSFRSGLSSRPGIFGPPGGWLRTDGGEEGAADVLIIVAADDACDLRTEVKSVEDLVRGSGFRYLARDEGRILDRPRGRDHFGFTDGISQPGIRGRASSASDDFISPRKVPSDPDYGKPGQELVWPGEFVFGYPDQDGRRDAAWAGDWMKDGAGFAVAPSWARHGSFMVFGRFRQDVGNFHRFLEDQAEKLKKDVGVAAARVVGRWPSGAPIILTPDKDDKALGGNDLVNNYFGFNDALPSIADLSGKKIPATVADPEGERCPAYAHIRKANPRDRIALASDRLRHRLLRRGIPYIDPPEPATTEPAVTDDRADRGLLFLSYMTSIVDQFEFVLNNWIRAPGFPSEGAGPDRLLAEPGQDWIVMTGGGYYFVPSISALTKTLSQ